ncbi:hypothetical protein MIND_01381900 [Mycena indigotica]|uniref:Uncharacterized protein n=1 Tax=Mycena indigotica TaxID=2126181 RepID=A0A8H6RYH8_9AGAR|nr:uncharacterized protein MIND_01381900 [Mycena indigotica]KAF7289207.1 hypothetical protein MIND_01381900 [Mycena indigotica]
MSSVQHPRLPLELLLLICQQTNNRDSLLNLCKTSYAFRVPAQRKLYEDVYLVGCSPRVILYWCRVIRRRPDLAIRVKRVRLVSPTTAEVYPEEADRIFLALTRCVNILWLELPYEAATYHSSWLLGAISRMQCPFRLIVFVGGAQTSLEDIRCMLLQQPRLRILHLQSKYLPLDRHFLRRMSDPVGRDPATVLPYLFAVKTHSPNVEIERHLQRIETDIGDLTPPLARYAASLTVLNIHFNSSREPELQAIFAFNRISQLLPNLLHLALAEKAQAKDDCWYIADDSPALTISRFPRLQTFTLVTSRISQFNATEPDGTAVHVDDAGAMQMLCRATMLVGSKTLRRLIIGIQPNEDLRFPERMFIAAKYPRVSSGVEIRHFCVAKIHPMAVSQFFWT